MSKINILPPSVYNRIAAGEVVERPYSVVKELVENAIDAGATEIEIYIEQGGKQLVRVIDNGSGIERDDLQSAFLPHATSKLSTADDLQSIMTLGFRGEAIASIASVSKMTITSKTENGKCYQLTSNGGELGEITETAGQKGTDVKVEMLFFNIPVRLSFTKSDKAEESDITTVVSRFILSHTDVSFRYYVNGKPVLQSFGGGEEEAIAGVYGASVLSQCYKIDATRNGLHIWGYIGNQNFFKANKSYQSVFLNGRYVLNNTIASAVMGAYASYLMKRQYPFYVLHIDMPAEFVDVNVHPNKADVRFVNNQVVYGTVHTVIASVLDGTATALNYVVEDERATEKIPTKEESEKTPKAVSISESILNTKEKKAEGLEKLGFSSLKITDEELEAKQPTVFGFPVMTYEEAQKEIENSKPRVTETEKNETKGFSKGTPGFTPIDEIGEFKGPYSKNSWLLEYPEDKKKHKKNPEKLHKKFPDLYFKRETFTLNDGSIAQEEERDYFEENKRYLEQLEANRSDSPKGKIRACNSTYVGTMFRTYIVYEHGDAVYIIDQHAAHERLIYDRLKEKMQTRNVVKQPVLVPYELKINAFEATFIRERLQDILDMGFEIVEETENCFTVTAVPTDLMDIDIVRFFNDILGDISGYRAIKLDELLKDKLATTACKAAVKGGSELTIEEIDTLFAMMDGDMGLKCPHGRPVVVKMERKQLEKMFKRIV